MTGPTSPQAPAGQLSPDGYWLWNGTEWVPVAQPPTTPLPPTMPPRPGPPWLRIGAGATAVCGVLVTLVACIVPYGTFPDPSGGPAVTSSIFGGSFSGAGWDVVEPVFVMLAGVAAATVVLVVSNRLAQALSCGLLLAIGAESATMWVAYVGVAASNGSVEAGGVFGVSGALLILIGGLLALANLVARPAMEMTAPTP